MPEASTFTNKVTTDNALVYKGRLIRPRFIIKFYKNMKENFTVWDDNVIKKWNGEKFTGDTGVIAMQPYLDATFNKELRNKVFAQFDARGFKFRDLITFKQFQKELELMRPRA